MPTAEGTRPWVYTVMTLHLKILPYVNPDVFSRDVARGRRFAGQHNHRSHQLFRFTYATHWMFLKPLGFLPIQHRSLIENGVHVTWRNRVHPDSMDSPLRSQRVLQRQNSSLRDIVANLWLGVVWPMSGD